MPSPLPAPRRPETVFTYAAPPLVFGRGAIGDLPVRLAGSERVLVVTDAGVRATGAADRVADALRAGGAEVAVYDGVHVEPTDASLRAAADAAADSGPWDAFVAVGGGS